MLILQTLVSQGNSVIVIEHNLDVIKQADYVIDLGPEGGVGGGELVFAGTLEGLSEFCRSHTGQYLKKLFRAHELSSATGEYKRRLRRRLGSCLPPSCAARSR